MREIVRRRRAWFIAGVVLAILIAMALRGSTGSVHEPSLPAGLPPEQAQLKPGSSLRIPRGPNVPGGTSNPGNTTTVQVQPVVPAASPSKFVGPRVPIVARDLANGAPVPGLEVTLETRGTDDEQFSKRETIRADDSGVFMIPEDGNWHPTLAKGRRRMLRQSADEIRKSGELWTYRILTVSGTVRAVSNADRELDVSSVALNVLPSGENEERTDRRSASQWDRGWLIQHGIPDQWGVSKPAKDGSFSLEFPAIRGVVLQAAAPGWRPEWKEIKVPAQDADSAVVEFRLQSAVRMRGSVRAPDGSPLKDALVAAYVVVRSRLDEVNPARLRLAGHPVKMIGRVDAASVIYVVDTCTDLDGGFELNLCVEGEVILTVHPTEGFQTFRVNLGMLTQRMDDLDLLPIPVSTEQKVRVLVDGHATPGHLVSISDLSVGDSQPTFASVLDSDSRLSADLLEEGHAYTIAVHPTHPPDRLRDIAVMKRVEWSSQAEIQVRTPGR